MSLLLSSIWFDLIWAMAVFGQQRWLWLTSGLVVVVYGWAMIQRHPLLINMVWVALLGIVIDYGNLSLGLFIFSDQQLPLWLVALWFAFSWYAAYLIPPLNRYPKPILCVVGGSLGSLSYWVGYRAGAVSWLSSHWLVLGVVFLQWLAITWLLIKVMKYEKTTNS